MGQSYPLHALARAQGTPKAVLHRRANSIASFVMALHDGGLTADEAMTALGFHFRTACFDAVDLATRILQLGLSSQQETAACSVKRKARVNAARKSARLDWRSIFCGPIPPSNPIEHHPKRE